MGQCRLMHQKEINTLIIETCAHVDVRVCGKVNPVGTQRQIDEFRIFAGRLPHCCGIHASEFLCVFKEIGGG